MVEYPPQITANRLQHKIKQGFRVFSRDTIRFYEKQGLISASRKARRDNNYNEYSD